MAPAVVPESTRALHEIFRNSSPLRSPSKDSTPLRLELHTVAYSMAELQQVANQITIRRPWAALISNTLAWWGIDWRHDVVTVALTAVTQDLQDLARREFGNRVTLVPGNQLTFASKLTTSRGPVQAKKVQPPAKVGAITNQQAGSSQVAPLPSRLLDGAPYYGGDRIYRLEASDDSVLVIQCTGGFGYSGPSMQTAGHCAPGGAFWTQGYWDQDSNFIYQTGTMGRVFAVEYGSRLPDGELMNRNTYGAVVWTQLQTVQTVRGTAFPAQGEGVCFDGSFTNENCSGIIDTVAGCANVWDDFEKTYVYVCGLDMAHSANNTRMCQPGDSGGPVYQRVPNGVKAAGIISATNDPGTVCAFTDINIFDADFGGSVLFSS